MNARTLPEPLYSEVFAVMSQIAEAALADKDAEERAAVNTLETIFQREMAAGRAEPFLTEALADVTANAEKSARLYRLALEQSSAFPGEPTHTKRIGLARQLMSMGDLDTARFELNMALLEAKALGDDEVHEIIAHLQERKRLGRQA